MKRMIDLSMLLNIQRRSVEVGRDMHTAVASYLYDCPINEVTAEQRAQAKVWNFGLLYRSPSRTVFGALKTPGYHERDNNNNAHSGFEGHGV